MKDALDRPPISSASLGGLPLPGVLAPAVLQSMPAKIWPEGPRMFLVPWPVGCMPDEQVCQVSSAHRAGGQDRLGISRHLTISRSQLVEGEYATNARIWRHGAGDVQLGSCSGRRWHYRCVIAHIAAIARRGRNLQDRSATLEVPRGSPSLCLKSVAWSWAVLCNKPADHILQIAGNLGWCHNLCDLNRIALLAEPKAVSAKHSVDHFVARNKFVLP